MRTLSDADRAAVLGFAHQQIGKPYGGPLSGTTIGRFGDGWDCSSLVSAAYAQVGVALTPFTDDIANETETIDPLLAQPGDLILYRYEDPTQPGVVYPHVGLWLDSSSMLDASFSHGGVGEHPILQYPCEIRRPGPERRAHQQPVGEEYQPPQM
ncbi:MAG: C40 family peptidase [Chloroflexi bacterium]|nr:C40 family peptidase [Chloroflexota bacterium]